MTILSSSFEDQGSIPKKFTCDGENISPSLSIADIPPETKSLALIVDDPDAVSGVFTHWVVWNINPSTVFFGEGKIPHGASEGENGARRNGYTGPCPPDNKPHRYFFKLYALDVPNLDPDTPTKDGLLQAMDEHIIEEAELMGFYGR